MPLPSHPSTLMCFLSLTGILYRPRHDEDNDRMDMTWSWLLLASWPWTSLNFSASISSSVSRHNVPYIRAARHQRQHTLDPWVVTVTTITGHVARNKFILLFLWLWRQGPNHTVQFGLKSVNLSPQPPEWKIYKHPLPHPAKWIHSLKLSCHFC